MDYWHCGGIAALILALVCEIWHGFCQHSKEVWESYSEGRHSSGLDAPTSRGEVPFLDNLFLVRQGSIVDISQDEEAVEIYRVWWGLGGVLAATHAPFVKAVGRIALAVFVIVGLIWGPFELPWTQTGS